MIYEKTTNINCCINGITLYIAIRIMEISVSTVEQIHIEITQNYINYSVIPKQTCYKTRKDDCNKLTKS